MLWLVWLSANLTMWMNDVAAAWHMTALTESAFMVAMVQLAASLPLFVLGLPSGALADMVDRRRYFAFAHLWVAGVAIVLAALSFTGTLDAQVLLACTFANGLGMAMRWPLFAAIVMDVVRRDELPAALALNGIGANMARIVGPIIAGALLVSAGGAAVYLLNAAFSLAALTLVLRWHPVLTSRLLPRERLLAAMRAGLEHVLHSPPLRIILLRIFLFFLQTSALMALLPLVALRLAGGGPAAFSSLLVAMGLGAIFLAFNLAWLRRHADGNRVVSTGICVHAVASVCAVLAPTMWLAAPAVAVVGVAWIATANSLTVAIQLALPDQLRARGMAIYQMAVMGGSAVGAGLWGYLATVTSVPASVITAAVLGPVLYLLTKRWGSAGDFP
jgi:MFS family permease